MTNDSGEFYDTPNLQGRPLLKTRLIASTIIISFLSGVIYLDVAHPLAGVGGLWLVPLLLIASMMAGSELAGMCTAGGLSLNKRMVLVGIFIIQILTTVPLLMDIGSGYPADCPIGRAGWPGIGLAAAFGLLILVEMVQFREPGGVVARICNGTMVILYTGFMPSFMILIRTFDGGGELGIVALISLVAIPKISDSAAYFTGKSIGKHKLAPKLSPGKTVEGAVGAVVGGCAGAWLFFEVLAPKAAPAISDLAVWKWLVYAIVLTVTGILGDLAESLIKRDMQIKDSSSWLPGLGGILDVMDSITLSAVPAYLCWVSGLMS